MGKESNTLIILKGILGLIILGITGLFLFLAANLVWVMIFPTPRG